MKTKNPEHHQLLKTAQNLTQNLEFNKRYLKKYFSFYILGNKTIILMLIIDKKVKQSKGGKNTTL